MNTAIKTRGVLGALLTISCLAFLLPAQSVFAQRNPVAKAAVTPQPGRAAGNRSATSRAVTNTPRPRIAHPYYSNLTQIPASLTQRVYKNKNAGKVTKAVGDASVTRQTTLLTYAYLTATAPGNNSGAPLAQPNVLPVAPNYNPNWSGDERFIYFTSQRNNNLDTSRSASGIFNLYRMFPDGSGVTQLPTLTADNKIEPNIAADNTRVAYVGGGQVTVNTDTTFTTSNFKLYYLTLTTSTVTALTERNPQSIVFTDVRHPSWSPGGNQIAFAAKTTTDSTHYHIYKVNTDTANITQLTTGTANETAPAWSPDGNVIAITTNATSYGGGGGNTPLVAQGVKNTTDIFVINQNLFTPDSTQVTNSAVNGVPTNNRNAAWSTLLADPHGFVPQLQLLAFASDRVPTVTSVNGIPTRSWSQNPNGSSDIYYVEANVGRDAVPAANGAFTVTTPESAGNPVLPLTTSSPDLLANGTGHNSVPTNSPEFAASFDSNYMTSEDYPSWPQYIHSYRITFQSNSNGQGAANSPTAIWASSILDTNAPTLLKYDIQNNQVVGVFRNSPAPPPSGSDTTSYAREFSAGETVRFRVKVADYESGVAAVFLQIKCPESIQTSADGLEHKIFFDGGFVPTISPPRPRVPYSALDGSTATGTLAGNGTPIEWDSQAIDPIAGTFQVPGYLNPGTEAANEIGRIPANYPGWNDYIAGWDDYLAYSGQAALAAPPTYWLPLYDNGPGATKHEPVGEIAGDGVWSGVWTAPANFPSDWYIDVIVFDKAIDPFDTATPPTQTNNWKIYDNVWGMTTKPFVADPRANVLYVNDYDCGQKLFQTQIGSFQAPDARLVSIPGVPTESWMTEFDPTLLPTAWFTYSTTRAAGGQLYLTQNTLGANSYNSFFAYANAPAPPYSPASQQLEGHDDDLSGTPPTQRFAQWRILSRGPIPDSVLNAFAPHTESQPADLFTANSQPRNVTVAERCVVWHSPYTGDLFIGPGTIIDSGVQNQLTNFVAKGGRLFLSGQDVAFGLSGGTPGSATALSSAFLDRLFHVQYTADQGGNTTVTLQAGEGLHPIATQTFFGGAQHFYPDAGIAYNPPSAGGSVSLNAYYYENPLLGLVEPLSGTQLGACPNPFTLNTLTATMAETPGVFGIDGYYGSVASPNIVWYSNPANGSKVVFSSVPWEAICPDFFTPASPPNKMNAKALKNRRTELMHNALDYLRTGRIIGNVRSVNGAQIFGKVFLRAVGNSPTGTGTVIATTYAQSDGTYVLDGLDATGRYTVDAYSAGFIAQHVQADFFHGGYQTQFDVFLTPAQPGSISGTVVADTGDPNTTGPPIPGAIVTATDPLSGNTYTDVNGTDVNGNFKITQVPIIFDPTNPSNPGLGYIVRVTNLAALGYASSKPYSFGLFGNESPTTYPDALAKVQVGNAQGMPQDVVLSTPFRLVQTPGTLTGQVTGLDANGNIPNPIRPIGGATVTIVSSTNARTTATTDTNGNYTVSLSPGSYSVTVSAAGYQAANTVSVTILTGKSTTQNFALARSLPGMLSGSVTGSNTTQYVTGATLTLLDAAGNPLKDADGNTVPSVTSTAVMTGTGSYTYNYKFPTVPAGSVEVQISLSGYKVGSANPVTVTVTSGVETQNVNFVLLPKASFDRGLIMVSAPQDYTTPITTLLNVSNAELFSYNTTTRSYDKNPVGRSDTFHRGTGYFLYTPNGAALTQDGIGNDAGTINIPLATGWNLIGAPYSFPVDFSQLNILDGAATVSVPTAQSETNPAIGSALFTYLGAGYTLATTLDAYHGYWLYAFRPLTLVCTPAARTTRAARIAGNNTDGWTLNLTAQAGEQHQAPAYLGVSRAATDGFDRFKATAPPIFGDQNVSVAFDHSDWGDKSGKYIMDVRSQGLTSQTWNFTVTSSVANTPVTLRWPSVATIPGKQSLLLTDLDSSQTVNLRNQGSYVIPASDKPITRHFALIMKRAGTIKLRLSDVVARNGAGGRAAGVVVSYRLSTDADVQINVMRAGQRVRSLAPNIHRAAGTSDAAWDLRDDKGVAVAGDTYTVEVRATDSEGNVVRQVTPLLVTR